jgi:protein-disulfide isomerase
VRFVWKDNPLPFHPRAKPSAALARVAYKAKGDKGFWDAHDALFESQPKLEDEDLKGISEKLGLSWDAIQKDIAAKKYQEIIDTNMDLASDLDARGTPAFFINGRKLSGAQPFESFKKVIDEQLVVAKGLVAKGTPKAKVYEEVMKTGKEPPPPEKKEVPPPPADSPWKGTATAKVVVQVFSDFQCPFCKRVEPTLTELEKAFPGKLKIVWRDAPLPFHQDAPLASQAAREAFSQKGNAGFWKYHAELFEAQGNPDGLKRENLDKIAEKIGLDMAKFKSALDSNKWKARVDEDNAVGQQAGISGTPSVVINGFYISGAQPIGNFKKAVQRALKEVK